VVLFASHEIFTWYEALTWAHQARLDFVELTNKSHPKEPLVTICHSALE